MLPKDQGSRLPDRSSSRSRCHALSTSSLKPKNLAPRLTSTTVSSVGSSCRQPNHHLSRTRGRLDLVMHERVTFLFSDWDADPRMVTALGGTAGMMGRRKTRTWAGCLTDQTTQTGIWGQAMRSLASDKHDLGAQTNGSLGHKLTDGRLAPGLTGDLQSDPTFLDPFRYTVVGLTAEPRPMVFWPHDHH